MRTLGFRTHVLLTLLACGGLAAALGMPWFGPSPAGDPYVDSPMDRTLETIGRAVGASDGASGRDALGTWAVGLTGLAAFTALMALLCLTRTAYGSRGRACGSARSPRSRSCVEAGGPSRRRAPPRRAGRGRRRARADRRGRLGRLGAAATPLWPAFGHPGVHVPPPPPAVRYESAGSTPPPGA